LAKSSLGTRLPQHLSPATVLVKASGCLEVWHTHGLDSSAFGVQLLTKFECRANLGNCCRMFQASKLPFFSHASIASNKQWDWVASLWG